MTEQHDDEATVIRPRRSDAPSRPGVPSGAELEDAEATVIRLIEPRPPAPRAPLPTERRTSVPTPPPPAAAEPAPTGAGWAVRVRGATPVVQLDRPVVVGRRPGPPRPGEHPEPRRLVVPADCADVSARHARIEQLGETLVVVDLGSTNGTVVHWSSGAPLRLRPGESTAVLPDAVIELGERLILEFLPATPTPEPPS
ncbi:FHA domain-containing protein [Microcella frigidaquae]|uniref:FHA domain-containing protein n=1 Tax=Microcella frigidaquae TaxID=424758 RepID=A0A840X8E8_9MICO|nr:hypothetical protein [Microcella frigidaquae]NHN44953.1 FHA domain-containing protein [Microcella frigidaquae]